MSTAVWLRICAIISLVFAAGHFLGGMQNWSPVADNPVLQSMRTVHFDVMGVNRSYLDFYMGFGYSITVSLLLQAVLLWILSILARTHASTVRPMIAAFAVATALSAVIAWRYIFIVPTLFSLVLLAALVVAFICARPSADISAPVDRG
ncbi:MAG: LIC_13387 family protein [Steroidobacteraceae bacterium]